MYKSFYNLERKAFEIVPDTSFLWLGENHQEALSTLRYGILDNKGFLLLTGDAGVGKTSMIKALTKSFDGNVKWGVIDDPTLERIDFYNEIARSLGINKKFTSKVQFLIQFSHFLHKADDDKKKVLLLIDECHLLSQEMLEELRLLSNIEKADAKLINIFFVGEGSFNELLGQPKNRAVRQRLTLKAEIEKLSVNETEEYIRHRLRVAGAEGKIFSAKGCQTVHRYSKGVPLEINKICDAALKLGASHEESTITPALIESALNKVDQVKSNVAIPIQNDESVFKPQTQKDYPQFKIGDSPDSKITGFNVEADRKAGWLKFGFAALVVIVIGGYLFKSYQIPMTQEETASEVVSQVVTEPPKELPVVTTSPAVAVMGENTDEINKGKVEELKSAILEKAYENESSTEAKAVVDGEVSSGEFAVPEGMEGQVEETVAVASVKPTERVAQEPEASQEPLQAEVKLVEAAPALAVVEAAPALAVDEAAPAPAVDEATPAPAVVEAAPAPAVDEATPAPVVVEAAPALAVVEATPAPAVVETTPAQIVEEVALAPAADTSAEMIPTPEPEVQLEPLEPRKVLLPLLPNSLKLTKSGTKRLNSFVEKLLNYPKATILIKGFVSSKSNSPENIKLSEDRALAVYKKMLKEGVDPEQIEIEGMGNREPIASNDTRAGRAKNRRVEILVISDGL